MDHPAVAQVVTFAVPHDKLGEEVAAAVVLREGAALRPSASCATSSARAWRISRCRARVVFLTEIPKGATGKLQRIGLADKLGPGGDEDLHLRRRRHRRPSRRQAGTWPAQEVTLIARGPHLAAMRENGLTLKIDGQELTAHVRGHRRSRRRPGRRIM